MVRKIDLDYYCARKFPFLPRIKFMAAVPKPAFALLLTVSEKPLVFQKPSYPDTDPLGASVTCVTGPHSNSAAADSDSICLIKRSIFDTQLG
jgi:hypothetical protein